MLIDLHNTSSSHSLNWGAFNFPFPLFYVVRTLYGCSQHVELGEVPYMISMSELYVKYVLDFVITSVSHQWFLFSFYVCNYRSVSELAETMSSFTNWMDIQIPTFNSVGLINFTFLLKINLLTSPHL